VRPDAGGNSIGYGHDLLPGESFPNGIDEAEAEALFQSDLAAVAQCINENVMVPLTQNQWDSLADFVYNEGRGTFQSSGFIFSEGKILSALITRRQAEIALWETL
jgi:lysozyme